MTSKLNEDSNTLAKGELVVLLTCPERISRPNMKYFQIVAVTLLVTLLLGCSFMQCNDKNTSSSDDQGTLWFSGYRWVIKSGGPFGPGPNYFSGSHENVWIDGLGLHLRISEWDSTWYCAEVFLDRSLGYGTYTYRLGCDVDSLDYHAVASGFLYESLTRELDIEFSGQLADPDNAQYVVQPFYHSGHLVTFRMPKAEFSSHRILWLPDSVCFFSWRGLGAEPVPESLIHEWTYIGDSIPPPGDERMHFNLWLFGGQPPEGGHGDEFVVVDFTFKQCR